MTTTQAVHLIEQFAAQAPFAVWITDSRGISIFANRKLHEMFAIPEHPSGALGFNLFDDPSIESLGLSALAQKAKSGEVVDTIIDIPRPVAIGTRIEGARTEALTIRAICYALRSSAQKIEHYVILISDVTEASHHRDALKVQLRDLAIYGKSKETRLTRLQELETEVSELEKAIRDLGVEPVA